MVTLVEIRSNLRSLMAMDENGEVDQGARASVLWRAICDLQDYEIMESDREHGIRLSSTDIPVRGGSAEPRNIPGQDQPRKDVSYADALEAIRAAFGQKVRDAYEAIARRGIGQGPKDDNHAGSVRDRGGEQNHSGSERIEAETRVQHGVVLRGDEEEVQDTGGSHAGAIRKGEAGGDHAEPDRYGKGEGS